MKFSIIIISLLFLACQTLPEYPEGGFEYPKSVTDNDTTLFYYQLKNVESKRDAFNYSFAYLFYQSFEEPNLSIKPQHNETFRLSYSPVFNSSIIITLTEDQIIVKIGDPELFYKEDTSALTDIEKFHLTILRRRFPIETSTLHPLVKKYLDSLTNLYPQLLDSKYYYTLYKKSIARNSEKMTYTTKHLKITRQDYLSIVEDINSSGFWNMNYSIDCKAAPTDGYGFTLEANTRKKYKIVNVTGCPGDTSKLVKACQRMVDLAQMNNKINLIWDWQTEEVPKKQ